MSARSSSEFQLGTAPFTVFRIVLHSIIYLSVSGYPLWLPAMDALVMIATSTFKEKTSPNMDTVSKIFSLCLFAVISPIIASFDSDSVKWAYIVNLGIISIIPLLSLPSKDVSFFTTANIVGWLWYFSHSPQRLSTKIFKQDGTLIFLALAIGSLYTLIMTTKETSKLKEELKKAKDALKEKEAQEEVFLKFSHELRNPVNSLLGSIELATTPIPADELKEHLRSASLSCEFLLHIVNNLLDAHKLKKEKLDFNPQNHDIFSFIESFWSMTCSLIKKKNLEGILEVHKSVPRHLNFDKHRVTQILLNLVSNALKFTDTGSIRIAVSFVKESEFDDTVFESRFLEELHDDVGTEQVIANTPKKVRFRPSQRNSFVVGSSTDLTNNLYPDFPCDLLNPFTQQENYQLTLTQKHFPASIYQHKHENVVGFLRIEVIDTGCGMTSEQSQKLFSKYSQVCEDNGKRQKGTGLGLWITKELCMLMGGDARVNSIKDIGTSFITTIKAKTIARVVPMSEESLSVLVPVTKSLSDTKFLKAYCLEKASKARVLIADDTLYSQDVTKKLFEKAGMKEVVCVSDGKEAFEEYKRRGPNYFGFLVFDVNMPGLNGIEASEKIRKYEETHHIEHIPIVFLTGESSEKTKNVCLNEDGAIKGFRYFVKPLSFKEIEQVIQDVKARSDNLKRNDSHHSHSLLVRCSDLGKTRLLL